MEERIFEMVKRWYAENAEYEWTRLEQDAYHMLEFIVTMHFLDKHLPKRGLILDAGGGPGRYTIELAKRGYDLVLLDISPELLNIARREIKRAVVEENVKQIIEGSITDLSMFDDETFDAVLCLGGPLNHILSEELREKAAEELVRVAKRGAPIFVSVISRLGLLKTILVESPGEVVDCEHHLEVGDYIPGLIPRKEVKGFTAAHWFMPEELRELFEGVGVEVIEIAALEGLSSHHREETNRIYEDKERWSVWVKVILKTCDHPSIIGCSEHFLLVGRKRER
ncbi:MAG: class I SAM-dependent methyltransferase [Thermoproteota archaeon]|nr:MAG: class I SAM-dependent methyltransferase [Candidatus Korarchaeota archaeon]